MFDMGALDSLHAAHRHIIAAIANYEAMRGAAQVGADNRQLADFQSDARCAALKAADDLAAFINISK